MTEHQKGVLAITVVALAYGFALYGEMPALNELIGGDLIVGSAWQMNRLG